MSVTPPPSPCVRVCHIGQGGWCEGCGRTLAEITAWTRADPPTQWAIVRAAAERRGAAGPGRGSLPT